MNICLGKGFSFGFTVRVLRLSVCECLTVCERAYFPFVLRVACGI